MDSNAPTNWKASLVYLDEPEAAGASSLTRRKWEETLRGVVAIERLPPGERPAWLLIIRDDDAGAVVRARELRRDQNLGEAVREELEKMGWIAGQVAVQCVVDSKYLPLLQKLMEEDQAKGGDG